MKQPLLGEGIPLDDCLNVKLTWWRTKDRMALWRAEARPDTWTVRVNDFPEDHLYTLLSMTKKSETLTSGRLNGCELETHRRR
jgi:hypothetical protein